MNERIKELYRQAHTDGFFGMAFDPEKFAELIVRECAKIADRADENGCECIGGNILIHFGVEE